jgi:hypothetical protein
MPASGSGRSPTEAFLHRVQRHEEIFQQEKYLLE